jgi:hypothetical protein
MDEDVGGLGFHIRCKGIDADAVVAMLKLNQPSKRQSAVSEQEPKLKGMT